MSHNLAFWIVKDFLLILDTIKLVRVAFFIRVGVKDVGRYRYFSKTGKEPNFGNGSGVWNLITAKTRSILITITEIGGRRKQIKLKPPDAMEKMVS